MGNTTVVPALNQIQYHIGMGPGPTQGLLRWCAERGVVVQAYAPLGGSSSVHPDNPYPLINSNLTAAIGRTHGKTGAQVALRWIVQQASDPKNTRWPCAQKDQV